MLWLCIRLPALLREGLAADERAALERLAAWAYQWSSLVSYRLGGTQANQAPLLWLELGASRALFGEPAGLLDRIGQQLAQLGYSHARALAPSAAAAALLTHAEQPCCVLTQRELLEHLAPLPLDWLELPAATRAALRSAGLRCIGEVLALPAAALARRFGPQCGHYLARLSGAAADPLPAFQLPEVYRARCQFDQELHETTGLLFALQRLLQEFQGYLRGRDRAVQCFAIELEHRQDRVTRLTIGLCTPAREAAGFLVLVRERLQNLTLAAPIRALTLMADAFTVPATVQTDLFDTDAQQRGELSHLLDRLHARLGGEALRAFRCQADHRPECAFTLLTPDQARTGAAAAANPQSPPRPAALLRNPLRIQAPAALLAGPERIESGWWEGPQALRDYYVARAADGARQWVFHDRAEGGWYLQGLWV